MKEASVKPGEFAETSADRVTRRNMLRTSAGVAAAATAFAAAPKAQAALAANGHPVLGDGANLRRSKANLLRISASQLYNQTSSMPDQQTNGDEGRYLDYRASYTKALPHNQFGEVQGDAYRALLRALESGAPSDFEAIPKGGVARQANPQAAYKYELSGLDCAATRMRPAPTFAGLETAGEMVELYWKAICRDGPFVSFDLDPMVSAVVTELAAFPGGFGGPKAGVNLGTVFRGETPGDLAGPYISQFLLKPVPYGPSTITQVYGHAGTGVDFMKDPG